MTPSLCGTFLTDKRSLVAFTWTITTLLTLVAFVVTAVMMAHTHTRYKRLESYYYKQMEYNNQYNDDDGEGGSDSSDREIEEYLLLSTMGSKSLTFAAVYTMTLALGLLLYGSTAIVGFTSLRGDYITPCFSSSGSPRLKLGVFGGAIIFFANLLLVCAVIFGEVRVRCFCCGVGCGIPRLLLCLTDTSSFYRAHTIFSGGRLERGPRSGGHGTVRSGTNSDDTGSRLHVFVGFVHYLCRTIVFVLWQ